MKLYFLFFFLLLLLTLRFITHFQSQKDYRDVEALAFSARLTASPEQRGRIQTFALAPQGYEPVYIRAAVYPEYEYGQVLKVSGKVQIQKGENRNFPTMYYPKIRVEENDSLLYGLIGLVRMKVMRLYESSLPPTSASLLMGIVFGIKQGMPPAFKDALQEVGVFHVVAASGMNVTLIAGAFMAIFGRVMKRQVALSLSILGIFIYAVLAGLEPSILRASIMGSIIFFSGILGRQNLALWTLALTGYLMLLFNPSLLTDIGFQLSFLATLGILTVKPVLKFAQRRGKRENGNLLSEDFKTTLAAQLATLPILLSAFGQVSFLSLFANMLVLWTIPPLMVIGSVSSITAFIFEPLGRLAVFLALPFLLYFEWAVMFFAKFNWTLRVESFPLSAAVGYYLVLFASIYLLRRRRKDSSI